MLEGPPMPKSPPRTPAISFRLTETDQKKLDDVCRAEGKNRPDIVRQAVIWYLDNKEKLASDMRETKLEKRIRGMENRLAGLIAKGNIDINTLLQVIYLGSNAPLEEKKARYKHARGLAVKRLRQKLDEDEELTKLYAKEIHGDEEDAEHVAP